MGVFGLLVAKVGALAKPGGPVKLFARGVDGALQSYTGGLLGFTMVGDIRALVYVSQGIDVQSPVGGTSYPITAVGDQGKKILTVGEGLSPKAVLESLKVMEGTPTQITKQGGGHSWLLT